MIQAIQPSLPRFSSQAQPLRLGEIREAREDEIKALQTHLKDKGIFFSPNVQFEVHELNGSALRGKGYKAQERAAEHKLQVAERRGYCNTVGLFRYTTPAQQEADFEAWVRNEGYEIEPKNGLHYFDGQRPPFHIKGILMRRSATELIQVIKITRCQPKPSEYANAN